MSYKVEFKPTSVIKANLGVEPGGDVQKFFTNTCYKAMDKYVPKDEGTLRNNVSMSTDGTSIIYEQPYAEYQYYGIRKDGSHVVMNYTTPGTGPYWDERMWSAEKDKVIRQVQNYMERGGK